MTQLIIDTGAAPNDGTGDPLRTAFTKVNYDFTAVYDAGPVGSNIQITDNRIITINTNGNLVLAPNGIGNVVSNVNILPNMSNIRSLGSSAYRWDSTYTRYLDAGSANITSVNIGNANIGNISTITIDVANIHILGGTNGYVLQTDGTGNLTWTAQTGGSGNATPGGANTQIQYNDAGVFGGTAGFTFDSTSNTLSAVKINTTDVFNSNGIVLENSDLTQGATAAVVIPTNGSSDPIQVNNTYGNIVLQSGVNADITGSWTFGNDGTTTLPSGAGFGQGDSGQLKTSGDTLSLDLRDQNGRGFYTNSDGYTLRSNGTYNWLFDTTGNLTLPGNINYANGQSYNQSLTHGSSSSVQLDAYADLNFYYANSEVGQIGFGGGNNLLIATVDGNIAFSSNSGNTSATWFLGQDGNLTLPGNTFAVNYANGTQVSLGSDTGNIVFADTNILAAANISSQYLTFGYNVEGQAFVQVPSDATANVTNTRIHNDVGNVEIGTGDANVFGAYYTWKFANNGNLNLPQGGYIGPAGVKGDGTMLTGGAGNLTSLTSYYSSGMYSSCVTVNADGTLNITNYGDGTGVTGQWQFTNAGNLILPPQNVNEGGGESQILRGSRRIINGVYTGASNPYAVTLPSDGSATVAYSTEPDVYINSAKVTFAVQGTGVGANWEQFDVVFTPDYVNSGEILWTVSNRIKANSTVADTIVTVAYGSSSQIQISLQLPVGQNGWASFDAVEFGLMVD